jgi:hypothetical protein
MNIKTALLYCPLCGLGFRHFKNKKEAHHSLVIHYKYCRKRNKKNDKRNRISKFST